MKGLLKSLEAIVSILTVFVIFVVFFGSNEVLPEFETINWQMKGFNALRSLDQSNDLRQYVLANSTGVIENKLLQFVPPEVNIKVVVCQAFCEKPDVESEKIISINYLIAGDVNDYRPRQIVLYMW